MRVIASLALLTLLFAPPARTDEDVPWVATPEEVVVEMLRLADVGPKDHVIDLGSGDGRIVIEAARRFGASGVGVEISPALVARSGENARRAGVADKVRFVEQDLFKADLARATVVTMYLMPDVNLRLQSALLGLKAGTRIVSHKWDLGDWKPDRTIEVATQDPKSGARRASRVHLWVVPADFEGVWCGEGNATGTRMQLAQDFQGVTGSMANVRGVYHVQGRATASRLDSASGDGSIAFEEKSDVLRVLGASGRLAHLAGTSFTRSCCGSCND